jgi:nucleotide-binding universal stress UspA family protein
LTQINAIEDARASIKVVRAPELYAMIRNIVVPVDGSTHADAAVDWASEIASKFDARVLLLHVVSERGSGLVPEELREFAKIERAEVTDWDIMESVARQILDAAERRARGRGIKAVETAVAAGNPAEIILEQAKKCGADLIVMGRRGLGRLPGLLLGSVSSKVIHLAECACLTVR